jgi:choline/glycine/proline betaine transport protein
VAWEGQWTTFYWGWWISWAPFVGVFIARISRGRTLREFVAGVLIVPTLVTFLWFSVMGGSAIYQQMFGDGGLLQDGEVVPEFTLFHLLDGLPLAPVITVVAIALITVFFVTSSDSGALVLAMVSRGGDPHPSVLNRVFWAAMAGAVAIALLLAGGLVALQTAAILMALPFSVVMIGICIASARAFHHEHQAYLQAQRQQLHNEVIDAIVVRSARAETDEIVEIARGPRRERHVDGAGAHARTRVRGRELPLPRKDGGSRPDPP